MEWLIGIILAAIGLFFVNRQGKEVGRREARREHAEEIEEVIHDQVDRELEETRRRGAVERVRAIRDRILGRTAGGSGS